MTDWFNMILRDTATEGSGGGGGEGAPEGGAPPAGEKPSAGMVNFEAAPEGAAPEAAAEGEGEAKSWDGPDWIAEKFRTAENPLEAQAKAYGDAQALLGRKEEAIREKLEPEIRSEIEAALKAERGVPEAPDAYEYPEGLAAPNEDIDAAFREAAHEIGVSPEQFQKLASLYAQTLPNPQVEMEKLGENAQQIASDISRWGSKNIPAELHAAASQLCTTADGVRLMQHMMRIAGQDTVMADANNGAGEVQKPLTRDDIRKMAADPRYADPHKREPEYVKKVERAWEDFAARQEAGTRARGI